jgi:hypothetical protein
MWIELSEVRVEAPVTDPLIDYAPKLEKYKAVQVFPL